MQPRYPPGLCHQLSRVADTAHIIDDQIVTMMNHILICSQDRGAFWNGFKTIWKEGAIEAVRQRFGFGTIIGHEQRMRHARVSLFCLYDSTGGKKVEVSVFPDNEIHYAIFGDMTLDRRQQAIIYAFRRVPVADEKQVFISISPLLINPYSGNLISFLSPFSCQPEYGLIHVRWPLS